MIIREKREIIIDCECGVETLRIIKYCDEHSEEYYLEFMEPKFYSKQDKGFWQKIKFKTKYIWYILLGKEYRLEQIILNREDIIKLIQCLNELKQYKEDEVVYLNLNNKED